MAFILRLLFAGSILLASLSASADRVELRGGRTLTGAIVSETAGELQIKTEIGTLRVGRGEVRQIVREGTTPTEVDGDSAAGAKKFDAAWQLYRQALASVESGSEAAERLRSKLAQIEQQRQQSSISALQMQFQQAQSLIAQGQLDPAIKLLEAVKPHLSSDEETSAVARLIGDAYFQKALQARDSVNEIEMERNLKHAIAEYPAHHRARLLYGEFLLRNSLTEEAGIEQLQNALAYGGNEIPEADQAKYHYMLGRKFFARGQFEDAAKHFAESLGRKQQHPAYADALDYAVKSYIKMSERSLISDFQKTVANLQEALRLNPENKDAHFLLGRMYMDAGQPDKAIEEFESVVEQDSKYPDAHYMLGLAYRDMYEYEDAIKHFDQQLQNDPTHYNAMVDLAEVYIQLANYDEAEARLRQAAQNKPDQWRAHLLLGQLAYARQQWDQARASLTEALKLKPGAVEAYVLMGKVLIADKKYSEAKAWFQQVTEYLEKERNLSFKYRQLMAETVTALGEIDLDEESPRQAETRFRRALEYVPDFASALNKIGDVKRRLGSESTDPQVQAGLYQQAEEFYQKAIEQEPMKPDFYLSLGILYHKNTKSPEKAIENYKKYLALRGPDVVNVNKWIEELGGAPMEIETTGTAIAGQTTAPVDMPDAAVPDTALAPAMPAMPEMPAVNATTATQDLAGSEQVTTSPVGL